MANQPVRIFFSSTLDHARSWQAALAGHLGKFEFVLETDSFDPASIDFALVWAVPNGMLARMTRLRAVQSLGAGINQLDPQQVPAHLPLARLVDTTLTRSMVDYARATVYRYHRGLDGFELASRSARWAFVKPRNSGETRISLLGLGEIGRAISRALACDGFPVTAWSRTPRDEPGIDCQSGPEGLGAAVSQADIVINVLPLTAGTEAILSTALFEQLKPGTRLINMGRGQHLVEEDLLAALENGHIAAATLDVTRIEPLPPDHPFWRHPGILITPHVAGLSSAESAAPLVAENVRRALRGDPLLHQVDRSRGY